MVRFLFVCFSLKVQRNKLYIEGEMPRKENHQTKKSKESEEDLQTTKKQQIHNTQKSETNNTKIHFHSRVRHFSGDR